MNDAESLSYAISKQLATAQYISTSYGDIPLDDEMRAAVDNAVRPILKRRLNARLADTAPQGMARATDYNRVGHVCRETGRVAMTVADAYAREDSSDRHFFGYLADEAKYGADPWRLIDGIDASTAKGADGLPETYGLDFASGRSMDVAPCTIIYMQRTKAERAA
ncbi:DUF2761 domain-containing protein [Achromobacter xylosoxidans]|uniref:DUF2761 domain-containing protein n=1 Tax=Alcaligenes xylosoxydans xylosoxydans TaxID=85698 RepID=UPI001F056911|nr:DUF2761 domain-containing protein [Achromobacter xylosoxidans]MCH1984835.1 DUF2761 domain-containing protein [Achromobacter xylosoxidans]MCH1994747.1 DUF2761 domain-containing protein [Achromobacter xylosoxidans]MCH4589504.1 DUF2761 domain-containing protein [Achromobacter xylosoxidans]